MNIATYEMSQLKIGNLSIKPYQATAIEVAARIDYSPFSLVASIDVNGGGKTAEDACKEFIENGCDYASLLSGQALQWRARAERKPHDKFASFNFELQNGIWVSQPLSESASKAFTDNVINFYKTTQALIQFGFKREFVEVLVLGRQDPEDIFDELDYIYVEEFLSLKNLIDNPVVKIRSNKLKSQNLIQVEFSISGSPYYAPEQEVPGDYVEVNLAAIAHVDYSAKSIKIKEVTKLEVISRTFDTDDHCYLNFELHEWLENLGCDIDNNPVLDYSQAINEVTKIVHSEAVAAKLRDLVF